jgi:hypothetical protein
MRAGLRVACAVAVWAVTVMAIATPALAKDARCEIKTADGHYSGGCKFTSSKGGSFSVSPVGRPDFFSHAKDDPGITDIDVDIKGSNADVRGLTTDGINSRWGAAKRSLTDKACWVGEDFSVCVY